MAYCSSCGTQIADGSTMCAACSQRSGAAVATTPSNVGGLADNVAGMLAYLFIPAIIFLVTAPYNRSRFVRFHSFQCIFLWVAWIALGVALSIVAAIPVLGWLTVLVWPLLGLAGFVLWIVLLLKANQGQMFKVPFIGDLAEKQANAM